MPGREIFAGKSKRSGRLGLLGKFGRSGENVFLGKNVRGDELSAETSKKGLDRKLCYSYNTVKETVLFA